MAKNLMIQGTMSNVGKSLLTAGLLRVLRQEGFRAAPFKSQNMALNSYITKEGLEMGRAQVMQAEAAGIEPSVCMNPVLLKPTSDVGSQVIVNGEVAGNYSAADYFQYKKSLIPYILDAYHKLEEQADIIVIEGAGSPAEINLKADDIVNMGMAKLVDAPVLLVGDIDRGGVFAQLLGTVQLLEEEEKARIKGFIINKFRGDEKLLEPGPRMLYERCGIRTLGVIPYLAVRIDEEDSLAQQMRGQEEADDFDPALRIMVVRLPHLSNFTDFNPISCLPFVSLQYVDRAAQLESAVPNTARADLLILPGSKNTIQDMKWLRESGMEGAICRHMARGGRVMGICGGYQMLGQKIIDASGAEGGGEIRGMGLLPVTTVLRERKQRSQIRGRVCAFGQEAAAWQPLRDIQVSGYEIHMGESFCEPEGQGGRPFSRLEDGREDGCIQGRVLGTYLHGIFETPEFLRKMMELLWQEKGGEERSLPVCNQMSYQAFKETQYDLLADAVRGHLDMEKIYEIIGI
ncbi:MAG: cobyric acid synthase [Clostridiales bacterium]|nr:cobyric acid synthase [Clostridiales bacterium]